MLSVSDGRTDELTEGTIDTVSYRNSFAQFGRKKGFIHIRTQGQTILRSEAIDYGGRSKMSFKPLNDLLAAYECIIQKQNEQTKYLIVTMLRRGGCHDTVNKSYPISNKRP